MDKMKLPKVGAISTIGIFAGIFAFSVAGIVVAGVYPSQSLLILRILLALGVAIGAGGLGYNIYRRVKATRRKDNPFPSDTMDVLSSVE